MGAELGQTIRQARKARGWSLKTFSEKIGISIMTLQRIETGQVSPSVKLMVEIAANLDRPITDFIRDKDRTLVRLKANRIKTWNDGPIHETAIFPQGVVEDNLGLNLAELEPGQPSDWKAEDYYKGLHLLEGEAEVEFEDQKLDFKQGETVYFDARYRHRLYSSEGAKLAVIYRR